MSVFGRNNGQENLFGLRVCKKECLDICLGAKHKLPLHNPEWIRPESLCIPELCGMSPKAVLSKMAPLASNSSKENPQTLNP